MPKNFREDINYIIDSGFTTNMIKTDISSYTDKVNRKLQAWDDKAPYSFIIGEGTQPKAKERYKLATTLYYDAFFHKDSLIFQSVALNNANERYNGVNNKGFASLMLNLNFDLFELYRRKFDSLVHLKNPNNLQQLQYIHQSVERDYKRDIDKLKHTLIYPQKPGEILNWHKSLSEKLHTDNKYWPKEFLALKPRILEDKHNYKLSDEYKLALLYMYSQSYLRAAEKIKILTIEYPEK